MKIGDRVGPYEVLAPLGAGGMGVVYRARDERLGRDVAIKVLPPGRLAVAAARSRFRTEAQALAKLNHPGIAAVYDVVEHEGADGLVLEYVPGDTLAKKLESGPLPPLEALSLGAEIAAALQEAHEHGVVHRDLKPGNIVVTPRGKVKVLDFGLAKLFSIEDSTADPSGMETDTKGISGTPRYMSPEQAEGRMVDRRTDLWSLGVVLYEALSGQAAFRGDGVLAVLRAVTATAPRSLTEVRPGVPDSVARIVSRCLEKDVSRRYQSASEVARDISSALTELTAPVSPPTRGRSIRVRVGPAILAVALVAAGGAWLYHRSERRRWAAEVAIPEVARRVEAYRGVAAFRLAREVERVLPADPRLAAVLKKSTRQVSIQSSPPGAHVEIQDYLDPGGEWYPLGTTPLEGVAVPRGYFRWRLSKPGGGEFLAAPATQDRMSFDLDRALGAPAGMSWVRGGRWGDMIDFIGWLGPYDLPPFDVDRLEVTNREYQAFVDAGGYRRRDYWPSKITREGREMTWDEASALLRDKTGREGPSTWEGGHYPEGQADLPVSGVSWYEADAYAAWAGKSLPALAQWFQAAPPQLAGYAVQASNFSDSAVAPAGSYKGLGPYGTYDMAGNVREWALNATDDDRRFILGGAWNSQTYLSVDPEALPAFDRSPTNGIRCVRNDTPLPAVVAAPIRTAQRDFALAQPVPDAVFHAYDALYAYDRTPLNARVEAAARESADWREEVITIDAAYGSQRLPVHLFLPKRVRPPFQAVVFFPSARVLFAPDSRVVGDVRFFDYVVQSGRAVVYPIYQGTYERRVPNALPGTARTTELVTQRFKDFARSIDYLATRPDVDVSKLAYLGVSMGSAEGVIYSTLVQDRLRAVIFLDGGFFLTSPPAGVDQVDFAPRLKKPVLMVNGRYDFTFSLERAQRPLFERLGTPASDKRHVVLDSPHDVAERRAELVPAVLGWLDKYLGKVE